MRRLLTFAMLCAFATAVGTSCSRRPAADTELVVDGQPLSHWIGQAAALPEGAAGETTIAALATALSNEKIEVLVAAADAIETIGPRAHAAAPALTALLDHAQPWVRTACTGALGSIGKQAVPALVETVRTGPGGAPVRAAMVLGAMGPDAAEAFPALKEMREKSPEAIQILLDGILAKLEPATAAPATTARRQVTVALPPESPAAEPESSSSDWPQFHGPRRDNTCRETGLLTNWSDRAPKFLWKLAGLGKGYSSVSIADTMLFTMGDCTPQGEAESQFVLAYDLALCKKRWATRIGGPNNDGPRCVPTVDGGFVYALGTDGVLLCAEKELGEPRWQKNLAAEFNGQVMGRWKYSESPLIDGDRLICSPGGPEATIVALNKRTGELLWTCAVPQLGEFGKDGAAYSSAVVADIDGVRQYIQIVGRGIVGVRADTGRLLWGYNKIASSIATITSPVVRGRYVFATTSYGVGSVLLKITGAGDTFQAEEVYFVDARDFENHHGGVVLVGTHIYGGSGQNKGAPTCLDLSTGTVAWKAEPLARGSAAILYADGHIIFRYDRGLLALVEATPDAFRLKGTFQPVTGTGPAWPHPVIHKGRLYLRHGDLLLCYDITSGS